MAKEKTFVIKIKNNAAYCGIGAGDVQFAYGKAVITDINLANWYRTHEGYEVTETSKAVDE